jgi:hypothetical protein
LPAFWIRSGLSPSTQGIENEEVRTCERGFCRAYRTAAPPRADRIPRADASDPKALFGAQHRLRGVQGDQRAEAAAKVDDVLFNEKLDEDQRSLSDLEKALDEQAVKIAAAARSAMRPAT